MKANWNVVEIAAMPEETNLRNLCRQIEQEYVDWKRHATQQGFRICREWPAIGELGRYSVTGVRVRFVTTHKRSIEVQRPDASVVASFPIKPGLAEKLYVSAGDLV